jgi:hypothetical protein
MFLLRRVNRPALCAIVCLAPIVLPAVAAGDEPSDQKEAKPHGNVSEISDWALAGVVWGDASFAKKMAVSAAKQTSDKDKLTVLHTHIQRLDQIIETMAQFGWRQLEQTPTASPKNTGAAASSQGAGKPYQESVKIAEAIDKGVGNGPEGPAALQNLRESSGLAERQYTPRDAETLSDSLPDSRRSLYQIEKYDPSSVLTDQTDDASARPTAAPNTAVDSIVQGEVDRLAGSENRTIESLEGKRLPQTNLSHFTTTDDKLQSDANWMQLQLDTNQLRWDTIGDSTISDGMFSGAMIQLKSRMQLASRITKNEQLRAALQQ